MLYKTVFIMLPCLFSFFIQSAGEDCIKLIERIYPFIPKIETTFRFNLRYIKVKIEQREMQGEKNADSDMGDVFRIVKSYIHPCEAWVEGEWQHNMFSTLTDKEMDIFLGYEKRPDDALRKSEPCEDLSTLISKVTVNKRSKPKKVSVKNKNKDKDKDLNKWSPVNDLTHTSPQPKGYALWIKQLQEANK